MVKKLLSIFTALVMTAAIIAVPSFASTQTVLYENALSSLPLSSDSSIDFNCADWNASGYTQQSEPNNAVEMLYQYGRKGLPLAAINYLKKDRLSSGKILSGSVTEFKFKTDNTALSDVEYYPVGFFADEIHITKAIKTVYIKSGKLYAVKGCAQGNGSQVDPAGITPQEICTINPDTWYTVKIMPIFTNETEESVYSVFVTDGTNEYRYGNLVLGVPIHPWQPRRSKIAAVPTITVAGAYGGGSAEATTSDDNGKYPISGGVFMKDLKIYTSDFINEFQPTIGNYENGGVAPALSATGHEGFIYSGQWDDTKPTSVTEDGRDAVRIQNNNTLESGNFNVWKTTDALGAGSFVIDATFKFKNAAASYYPITFETDVQQQLDKNSLIKTVWVREGKMYAKLSDVPNNMTSIYDKSCTKEICTVDSNKWYDIRLYVNADGDASTADTYCYEISDGTNTYYGGPYAFGQAVNDTKKGQYNLTTIKSVAFGVCGKWGNNAAEIYIDKLRAYNYIPMTAAASGKTITFSEAIEPRTLTSLTLTKGGVKYPFTYSLSQDKKTVTVNTKELLGDYTLTIPANVVSASNKALANALTVTISETASAQVTKTTSKTGNIMVVTAVCKNTSSTAQTIKVAATAGDAQASVTKLFKAGEEKTFTMTLKTAADSAAVTAYAADGSVLASN